MTASVYALFDIGDKKINKYKSLLDPVFSKESNLSKSDSYAYHMHNTYYTRRGHCLKVVMTCQSARVD